MRTRLKPGTIQRARRLRTQATDAERVLWYKLREMKRAGYHFRRQAPFRSYILDFVEHSAKLVIEVDGGQHADDRHMLRDRIRDRVLENEGYRVFRFWNGDVLSGPDAVADYILSVLRAAPPPGRR